MEASTQQDQATAGPGSDDGLKPLSERERKDPRNVAARAAAGGERGREMLEHAAQGADLNPEEELAGLDWLLGTPQAIGHTVPVDFETPKGMAKLKFHVKRIDPRKIDEIEVRNVNPNSGRVDRLTADFEIVAEICDEIEDAKRTTTLGSEEFLTVPMYDPRDGKTTPHKVASSAIALEKRFVGQEGLITLVAAELRRLCGYDSQRIGQSQRRLVEASLG